MTIKYYYIPKKLDLDALVTTLPIGSKLDKDKIGWLISNIYRQCSIQKDDYEQFGQVNLSSKIMQSYVHNYKEGLEILNLNGIISSTNSYSNGTNSYCKSYSISESYKGDVQRFTYTKSYTYKLNKNLRKTQSKPVKYLDKWFEDLAFEFDYNKAVTINQTKFKHLSVSSSKSTALDLYSIYSYDISRVRDKSYQLGRDSTSGRYHNCLTNLKKDFRSAFSYNHQPLFQVDLKNSQPFLMQMLFDAENIEKIKVLLQSSSNTTSTTTLLPSLSSSIMLVKSPTTLAHQEFTAYKVAVNSGVFYEDFMQTAQSLGINTLNTRGEAKKAVYLAIFSSNKWKSQSVIPQFDASLKLVFIHCYPHINQILEAIKSDNKNSLAIILQIIEAYLIIDVCCKRISTERPSIPLFTIHDSISTIEEFVPYVKDVMEQEIEKFVGAKPALDVSQW